MASPSPRPRLDRRPVAARGDDRSPPSTKGRGPGSRPGTSSVVDPGVVQAAAHGGDVVVRRQLTVQWRRPIVCSGRRPDAGAAPDVEAQVMVIAAG